MPPSSICTASRKPDGYNKAHLQEYCFAEAGGYGQVLQAWMISQIPGEADGLDQLVCDGKTLRGSAIETEEGNHRFVARSRCTPGHWASRWPRRPTTLTNPVSGLLTRSC